MASRKLIFMLKFIVLLFLLSGCIVADQNNQEFLKYQNIYYKSVVDNNKAKQTNALKNMIKYGKKAKKPTKEYEEKLSLLTKPKPKIKVKVKKIETKPKNIKSLFERSKQTANNTTQKQKTIVIDPGHGGHDSGAKGYYKQLEKDVVLKVGLKVKAILKKRGYKVYNTRDNDKFQKLHYRTQYANNMRANLFISIHANAVPRRNRFKAYGIETYYLSPARSSRAKRVAAKENSVDIRSMSNLSKSIFLMARNRAKINESNKLALDIQNNILYNLRLKYDDIKDHGVRQGPFWILVGAQMPAVLLELGYITHPKESKRLTNDQYQKELAIGIANGIDSYFRKNP